MKIRLNKDLINKSALIIIPLLILLWLISSLLFEYRVSFSVVTHQTKNNAQTNNETASLYKDNSYRGEFKSKASNLGIIILEGINYKKPQSGNEDNLIFRFREKGKKNWLFQREYKSGLFDSQTNFSFGFPAISDSKNKNYEFEILSTNGTRNNHIKIKKTNDVITGYQYSKSEILGGSLKTIEFVYSKFIGFITDLELLLKSLFYLFPLAIFLIIYFILRHISLRIKHIEIPLSGKIIKIFVLLILAKILIPEKLQFHIIFLLIFVWVGIVYLLRLKSIVSFFHWTKNIPPLIFIWPSDCKIFTLPLTTEPI